MPKNQSNDVPPGREMKESLAGRVLALDLGQKRVGVAICDELRLTIRPLRVLERTNWKKLLRDVAQLIKEFDAQALVIGLPLMMDGSEGSAALEARRLARNFGLSLSVPVFLQDERLTSHEAESSLRASGYKSEALRGLLDSESAAIILRDFLADGPDDNGPAS